MKEWRSVDIFRAVNTGDDLGLPSNFVDACDYVNLKTLCEEMNKQLNSCRAAMAYAYEDHGDQYYLNVEKDIDAILAKAKEVLGEK